MTSYFADTGYWLALLDLNDDLHKKAESLAEQVERDIRAKVYTTDLVLTELLNSKPIYSHRPIRAVIDA